jgi:hypothetical protein
MTVSPASALAQDMDGIIGVFSGSALPPNVSTETGLLRITFASDASIEGTGWAAAYTADVSVQAALPECAPGAVLVEALLRTRLAASELSWAAARRAAGGGAGAAPPTVVMAGGLLPAAVQLAAPAAVLEGGIGGTGGTGGTGRGGEYKDFRSYYSYACLAPGPYQLDMYDSRGDGWGGARLTVSALVIEGAGTAQRVAAACPLAGGTVERGAESVAFALEVRRGRLSPATTRMGEGTGVGSATTIISQAPNPSRARPPPAATAQELSAANASCALEAAASEAHFVLAQLAVGGEDSASFTLTKQKRIKDALALLLGVDASQARGS